MDFGFINWLVVGVIAFLVLGPTEMVKRANQLGRLIGRLRNEMENLRIMAQQEIMQQEELERLRQAEEELRRALEAPATVHPAPSSPEASKTEAEKTAEEKKSS